MKDEAITIWQCLLLGLLLAMFLVIKSLRGFLSLVVIDADHCRLMAFDLAKRNGRQ